MVDLLSSEQLIARARSRREQLSNQVSKGGFSGWPIVVEGWSNGRQVFGFAPTDSELIAQSVAVARSCFNADTVVVFSDARVFSPNMDDPEERRVYDAYMREEVTQDDLARQGHPAVMDLLLISKADVVNGVATPIMQRYLTRYSFGHEVGVVWDEPTTQDDLRVQAGRIPDALEWSMRRYGVGTDGEPMKIAEGGQLIWEAFDSNVFESACGTLGDVSNGRFVVLNSDPKIGAASGLKDGSAPNRIAAGDRSPEVVMQLVAREERV